jgi:predicted RNA polymerase sigma factor
VLYLIFNEGYTASSGSEPHRADLAPEAIRLARLVHAQLPEDGEVTGLLAVAETEGLLAGLALLSTLDSDERIAGHHRLLSVRARLLEKTGDTAGRKSLRRLGRHDEAKLGRAG